ncbi:MAG: hypothetical protein R3C60_04760 [Parvularculaceae bacterium]
MSRTVNLILAALLSAAALAAAISLARVGGEDGASGRRVCAERLCGVVFF